MHLEHRCSELRGHLGGFFFDEYTVSFFTFFDNFRLKVTFIQCWNGYSSLFRGTICLENCFPAFYSEVVSVFDTEVHLLLHIQTVSLYIFIGELSSLILRDIKEK